MKGMFEKTSNPQVSFYLGCIYCCWIFTNFNLCVTCHWLGWRMSLFLCSRLLQLVNSIFWLPNTCLKLVLIPPYSLGIAHNRILYLTVMMWIFNLFWVTAADQGVGIETMKMASWTCAETLATFYKRPIQNNSCFTEVSFGRGQINQL